MPEVGQAKQLHAKQWSCRKVHRRRGLAQFNFEDLLLSIRRSAKAQSFESQNRLCSRDYLLAGLIAGSNKHSPENLMSDKQSSKRSLKRRGVKWSVQTVFVT